jgi:hypothetical protein
MSVPSDVSDKMLNPEKPENSFRITLTVLTAKPRIDQVLLEELRKQGRNTLLKRISRTEFKELFKKKRIRIKGQPATPSSSLAAGSTVVDILGYDEVNVG